MNVSGILVVVPPAEVDASIEALGSLPGVEVHHREAKSGRIVITQEGECVDDEVDGLKRIKALPKVILAEMVYHYFEKDREIIEKDREIIEKDREIIENVSGTPEEKGRSGVPPFLEN